ncbi:MAG: ATP-binding protein, partial [Planctomycetia bacterium]|nr:ATP-binding protein [Planctomycetia bacterium]
RSHSERTAREIDEETKRILDESLEKVRHILEVRRAALVALTELLIEVESVDASELKRIIEESSPGPVVVPGTLPQNRAKESENANRPDSGAAEQSG